MLLEGFDRHLTLKDVVSSFYKDPRFPLIPSLDYIRDAIFAVLQEPDHAGPGTGGWELIGSDGSTLHVESAKQIAINSVQIQLRRRISQTMDQSGAATDRTNDGPRGLGESTPGQTGPTSNGNEPLTTGPHDRVIRDGMKKPDSYSWYSVELTNRSITDEAKRDNIRRHLIWLAGRLDDDALDHQLITLKYDLMAGSDPALTADLENRATAIDAKVQVREET